MKRVIVEEEDKNLFVDLYNKSPDIIIDFENVIDQITESKSWHYIIKKYDLIENKNIKIFK